MTKMMKFKTKTAMKKYNKAFEEFKAWSDLYINTLKTMMKLRNDSLTDLEGLSKELEYIKNKEEKAYQKLQEKKEKFYKIRSF